MPAFTPQAMYRRQLAVLSNDAAMRRALTALMPQTDVSTWRRLTGRFSPGSRPYASIWYQCADAPLRIARLDCFPDRPQRGAVNNASDSREWKLPCDAIIDGVEAATEDAVLGWLCLTRLVRDPPIAGFRVHRRLKVTRRGTHYEPGRALSMTVLHGRQRYRVQFARSGMIRGMTRHMQALAELRSKLPVTLPDGITVRPRLAMIGFESMPATPLSKRIADGGLEVVAQMVEALCSVATSIPASEVTAQPANAYWNAIDTLQGLARTHPGFDDLCADLVARLTEAHARAGNLSPVCVGPTQWHVWGANDNGPVLRRAVLLRALPLPALQAELDAQALQHQRDCAHPAETLQRCIGEVFETRFGRQDPRLSQLFAAQIDIRRADRAVQQLEPDGDDAARALLMNALKRLSR